MKKIELFENVIKKKEKDFKGHGINGTLFWAYHHSIEAGNDLIDLSDAIWDDDITEISDFLKQNEITQFTVSSPFSGLIKTLAAFDSHGFKVSGIKQVNANYRDLITGQIAIIPALILTLQE